MDANRTVLDFVGRAISKRFVLAACRVAFAFLLVGIGVAANAQEADVSNLDKISAQLIAGKASAAYALQAETAIAIAPLEGVGKTKSLANGLYLSGRFQFAYSANAVSITLDKINNTSPSRTSGTLRLELWATTSYPARGEGFTGYRLAVTSTFSPLAPMTSYTSIVRNTTFTPPPNGTYWIVLLLTEFDSVNCSASDHYCISDSGNSDAQIAFGSQTAANLTVLSSAGRQCYQNYPASAYTYLQQVTPGLFQSYSGTTTCASLGMSYYAGILVGTNLFSQSATVSVFTPDQSTAAFLCQSGFLTSCTAGSATYNYSDLWWNSNESGWGVTITHHGTGIIFVTWFTYDSAGKPKWYVASNCPIATNTCTGTLYETSGPPFGPTFNSAAVSIFPVGSITLTLG